MTMGRKKDRAPTARGHEAVQPVAQWRLWSLPLLIAVLLAMAGCATTPDQRTPWHQYLHDHGLE